MPASRNNDCGVKRAATSEVEIFDLVSESGSSDGETTIEPASKRSKNATNTTNKVASSTTTQKKGSVKALAFGVCTANEHWHEVHRFLERTLVNERSQKGSERQRPEFVHIINSALSLMHKLLCDPDERERSICVAAFDTRSAPNSEIIGCIWGQFDKVERTNAGMEIQRVVVAHSWRNAKKREYYNALL